MILPYLIILMFIIILVFLIWVEWYIAKQFSEAAEAKGYRARKYFWICFLLTWVGYLLVIALPDRGNVAPEINDELPDL